MARPIASSARLMPGRLARISGLSIALLRMSPRSPPVSVQTRTSAPSRTYFAIVAAPLLDSSSGWACTAISRSGPSPHASAVRDANYGSAVAGAETLPGLADDTPRSPSTPGGTRHLTHPHPPIPELTH